MNRSDEPLGPSTVIMMVMPVAAPMWPIICSDPVATPRSASSTELATLVTAAGRMVCVCVGASPGVGGHQVGGVSGR